MLNRNVGKGNYNLRSGLVILPTQQEAIDQVLSELAQRVPAQFLLLSDVTGQVVSVRGESGQKDLVSIGSLVAGDLAASQEIARLTGQYQEDQLILREGGLTHTYIIAAGDYLALLAQASNEVPLGWTRMLVKKTAKLLTEITATSLEREAGPEEIVFAGENLADLFSDALDEIWQE